MCYQYSSNSAPNNSGKILKLPPTKTNLVGMPK